MSQPLPITASSVRGLNDHPDNKVIDEETEQERTDYLNWAVSQVTPSMYSEGGDFEAAGADNVPVGTTFASDALKYHELMNLHMVLIDAAAQKNGNWMYCYLHRPHASTDKDLKIRAFHTQAWTVTNTGAKPITVYVTRYDSAGEYHSAKPVVIAAGSRANIQI